MHRVETVICGCVTNTLMDCIVSNFTFVNSQRVSGAINGPCFRDELGSAVTYDCFATYLIIQGLASNSKAPPYFKDISVIVVDNNGDVVIQATTLTRDVPLDIAGTTITRSAVTAPYKGVFTVESINFSEGTFNDNNVCLLLTASDNQHGALIPYTVAREP
ncbi:unnamed protein product [Gordionus sp. m RMFG-2023]|uniref:uncharacterized protein LOC135925320 n=1 Tax=Gordionus sp. m RMFG-2023 TaxID=3053472 RepID=UPI0030E5F356